MSATASSIALHVETAKRLLDELEQHAEVALGALGQDGEQFLAAVNERDRVLDELNSVVSMLARERLRETPEDSSLLDEMAHHASRALESHETLRMATQLERDRLAAALAKTSKPDGVATQYAAATAIPRTATLSVTG
jgi:hypothetical protein